MPPIYAEQLTLLEDRSVLGEDFNDIARDAVNSIEVDLQVNGAQEDAPLGWEASASVSHVSKENTKELISSLGQAHQATQNEMISILRSSLLDRFNEVLGPLDTHMAPLRELFTADHGWIDIIDRLGAKKSLMEYAPRHKVSEGWWEWMLSGSHVCVLDDYKEESALSLLSRRYLNTSAEVEVYPEKYAKHWLDLALDPGDWKTHSTVHALWLASELKDPSQRLARELDARGFEFEMKRVNWRVAIRHEMGDVRPVDVGLTPSNVENFLERHFSKLITLDPDYVLAPYESLPDKVSEYGSARNLLSHSNLGFIGLLANVSNDALRDNFLAQMEALQLAQDTANWSLTRSCVHSDPSRRHALAFDGQMRAR